MSNQGYDKGGNSSQTIHRLKNVSLKGGFAIRDTIAFGIASEILTSSRARESFLGTMNKPTEFDFYSLTISNGFSEDNDSHLQIGDLINFVTMHREEMSHVKSFAWFASIKKYMEEVRQEEHGLLEDVSLSSAQRELEFLT